MPRPRRCALVLLVLVAALSACAPSQSPILQLEGVGMLTPTGRRLSEPEVREALLRALYSKGWSLDAEEPGRIVATEFAGGHSATILVEYAAGRYSIRRQKTSPGLRYDPDRQIIHKRYNLWIDRLRVAIHAQIPTS